VIVDPLIAARGVHFAATALACGSVVFMALVAEPAAAGVDIRPLRCRLIWLTLGALAVCGLSGAVWLALIASDILGAPLSDVCLHGGVWEVATGTRFGEIACARLVIVAMLAFLLIVPGMRWLQVAAAVTLIGLIAPTGHAGATPGPAGMVHLASDTVHLIAAGAWVGALPAFVMVLLSNRGGTAPTKDRFAVDATRRFSLIGIVCVAALALSGLINSWWLLSGPGDLLTTSYGRLLALKMALFATMVVIAAVNRYYVTPRLPGRAAKRALARNTGAEIALGLAVLFLAGALGTMPPSGHVHIPSATLPPDAAQEIAFVHIHSEEAMADLTIDPGHAGKTTATIRLSHEDFTVFTARSVRLALDPSSAGLTGIEREAVPTPEGNWNIMNLNIPAADIWTARVIIDAGGAPIVLDAPIVITQCSNEC